jgi:hypothetical protein
MIIRDTDNAALYTHVLTEDGGEGFTTIHIARDSRTLAEEREDRRWQGMRPTKRPDASTTARPDSQWHTACQPRWPDRRPARPLADRHP